MRAPAHQAAPLLVAAALAAAVPARADPVSLTVPEARALGRAAWAAGDNHLAWEVARGLLARDPGDVPGLLLLSAAGLGLGQTDTAAQAARAAYATAPVPALRFEAARLAAGAAVADDRYQLAQYWLRRALDDAPSPDRAARTAAEFRAVRARTPWRLNLSFALAPSSNLNGGASDRALVIDGVPWVGDQSGSARALSGLRAEVGGQLLYRLSQGPTGRTEAGLRLFATHNWLSDEAKKLAPTVKGSDLNYTRAEVILRRTQSWPGAEAPLFATLAFGESWSGGAPYASTARLGLSQGWALGPQRGLTLGLDLEHEQPRQGADVQGLGLSADLTQDLPGGATLGLGLGIEAALSDSPNSDFRGAELRASYAPGQPIAGAQVEFSLAAGLNDYHAFSMGFFLVPGGRQDRHVTLGLDVTLPKVSVAGFAPVIGLEASRSWSNISRYQGDEFGLSLGFASLF